MKRHNNIIVKIVLFTLVCLYVPRLFGQIKVGNNPTVLNPNAVLEIESNNKGLLLPRLALSATTNTAPLTAFVPGMFVFNTVTAGDVTPGIYYSDGTKWVRVSTISPTGGPLPTNVWSLAGNNSTTAADFLGTGDLAPLVVKTNNAERMRITEDGWVGIGTATPQAALHIKGQLKIDTLTSGNTATDSFLVANPADGRVKMVSASAFSSGMRKSLSVATSGQTIFNTPAVISDISKVSLYRNGVLISCSVNNATSVIAEVACAAGDEIRIVQLL
jgi:hypothetical protein